MNEIEWREALYRQLARQPGIPAGLRPELIKRAETCTVRAHRGTPSYYAPRPDVQGCKGAISR
ncbi:hypothetical protein [Sphingomonas sp.]|jgi:hypothetical protein|uniref:hypothetical protein n=1 Tax=Sphingomonas sp. TaxID=28214 RepID=UPI002DF30272|nr:hypothetical protein [Sphingomonas sp.]